MPAPSSLHMTGLTVEQVHQRKRDGRINVTKGSITKPVYRILIDNICTFFNLFNLIIAAALIAVRSYHNLFFLLIITVNTAVGIIQELRSKLTLEKLSVLSAARARVVRDGSIADIPVHEIVQDDTILFENGNQICVDAIVTDGEIEVNESLLTGELTPVLKQAGDHLLSGSFVVSGSCTATVEHVGADNYAVKLTQAAKKHKRLHSQLMDSINRIIRFTGFFIIPFGALLVLRDLFINHTELSTTVTATSAALLGMMPQGLVLLTTVSLVVGVMRLARKKTLVQELYCIETLSRVDTLCLDKTGTLTKGTMEVSRIIPWNDDALPPDFDALVAAAIDALGDTNPTAQAIRTHFSASAQPLPLTTVSRSPFSSQRKWSAVSFENTGTVFFGAYDRLLAEGTALPAEAQGLEAEGKRLLLIAFSEKTDIEQAKTALQPLAIAVLEDQIRENAAEILDFFRKEDVSVRIISGDHPLTVSSIAKKAGIPDYDNYVDAGTLQTPEQLADAAAKYTIFGRVLPAQKKALVQALKAQGHTVAMTGDGVNDVLALKEADCSIAVAAGSDAAKQVSQLVLLDSDFASLPSVVMEGRRVINNITRTASLFLVKTIMSFLVTICVIVLPTMSTYPFQPIQLSMIGLAAESIPGFFLTLEPSRERVQGSFLRTVLSNALPSALIITAFVVFTESLLAPMMGLTDMQSSTLCVYITGFVWLIQLFRICRPFSKRRRILWGLMVGCFFGGELLLAELLTPLNNIFGLHIPAVFMLPTLPMWLAFAAFALITYPLDSLLYRLIHRFLFREKAAKHQQPS